MKITEIISIWFNIIKDPEGTIPRIEEIELSDGIKSLGIGFAIPTSMITAVFLFVGVIALIFFGITAVMPDMDSEFSIAMGSGILMFVVIYIIIILLSVVITLLFCTLFAGVIRLICKFSGGTGSFRKDLGLTYFLAGGLGGICGLLYVVLMPIWLISIFIPFLGIILGFIMWCVFLVVMCFISGSYLGAFLDILSKIENKSLTRLGGIIGVAYAVAFAAIYAIFVLIYILVAIFFFASMFGIMGSEFM